MSAEPSSDDDFLRKLLGSQAAAFDETDDDRPVDRNLLKLLHAGDLPRALEIEIRRLTITNPEWAAADRDVCLAILAESGFPEDSESGDSELPSDDDIAVDERLEQPEHWHESLDPQVAEYMRWELSQLRDKLRDTNGLEILRSDPLAAHRRSLRKLICEEWGWTARKSEAAWSDKRALATAIAALIRNSTLKLPFPPELVAVLLVKEGLDSLCDPFR